MGGQRQADCGVRVQAQGVDHDGEEDQTKPAHANTPKGILYADASWRSGNFLRYTRYAIRIMLQVKIPIIDATEVTTGERLHDAATGIQHDQN